MQIGECGGGRNRLLRGGRVCPARDGGGAAVRWAPDLRFAPSGDAEGGLRSIRGSRRGASLRPGKQIRGAGMGRSWPSPLRVGRHEHILAVLVVASCERSAPRNTVGVMGVGPGPPFFVCSDQIGADDTRPCG
jgi:hypothetical protein